MGGRKMDEDKEPKRTPEEQQRYEEIMYGLIEG